MAKTWTREELKNLTPDQFNSLSQEEQFQVKVQGKAFLKADLEKQNFL